MVAAPVALHFWAIKQPTLTTMNPLTFLAFVLGINGNTPATPPQQQQQTTVKETTKPADQPGAPKGGNDGEGRGGWDRN